MPENEIMYSPKPISEEEERKLINRVYNQHVALKATRMEELDHKYYPMAPPIVITPEKLKASITRQVDNEIEKRKMKQMEAEAAAGPRVAAGRSSSSAARGRGGPRVLDSSEVEANVERMYTQTLEKSKIKREELVQEQIKREHQNCLKTKTVGKSTLQEIVNRLSVPKKTTFTTEEVNKMYGLSE